MLLIAEIILTVLAWRKGWKWLSLIPLGLAFIIGFIIGASGTTIGTGIIFIDVLAVIALTLMLIYPPKNEK